MTYGYILRNKPDLWAQKDEDEQDPGLQISHAIYKSLNTKPLFQFTANTNINFWTNG